MIRFDKFKHAAWTILAVFTVAFALGGCEGDDGRDGAAGAAGLDGTDGTDGTSCWDLNANGVGDLPDEDINGDGAVDVQDCAADADQIAAAIGKAQVESCATCHGGVGDDHQAFYDLAYNSDSNLQLRFATTDVSSVADAGGGFTVTLNFTITDRGLPYEDAVSINPRNGEADGLRGLDQARFYTVQHFSGAAQEYLNSCRLRIFAVVDLANGEYSATSRPGDCAFEPENSNAQVYGYITRGEASVHSEGSGAEFQGQHVHLYDDVSNWAVAFGTAIKGAAGAYESLADPQGCESCHGTPYLKHGYRAAELDNIPDFAGCKSCHYDNRNGGHEEWQYMVDDPFNWATAGLPDSDVATKYAYTANVMNDTHMSHAMEFPFPQSMANCATCHTSQAQLTAVLDNSNFQLETCKSCHPIEGNGAWPKSYDAQGNEILDDNGRSVPEPYNQGHRPPAFAFLWQEDDDLTFHENLAPGTDCTACHGLFAPSFSDFHSGYDHHIYDDAGNRYADIYTVSIDSIARNGDELTIQYSASDTTVAPFLAVSFYGWDSKHFIVPSHTRDGTQNCTSRGNPTGCRFEYRPGDANPIFAETANSVAGAWEVVVDMAAWVGGQPDSVPNLIAANQIRKIEVSVIPSITIDGEGLGLNAVSTTFDLGANAVDPDWFKMANAVVDVEKCNACHDKLGQTFHGSFGVGGTTGDRLSCVNCHNPTYDGGHIEMASRSIDNYVHAIHSFQDFDPGDTFDTETDFDPVLAKRYDLHVSHTFPNFTIRNCEACHNPGTYNVPDQSQSMPGLQSKSETIDWWYSMVDRPCAGQRGVDCFPESTAQREDARNIGAVGVAVTGPASRSCGGCHRADLINDDEAGDLAAFNAHTEAFGTYVPVGNLDEDDVLFGIIEKIMSWFE